MRIIKRNESQIQTEICIYLKLKHYFFWRENNIGVWDQKRGAYRSGRYGIKGIPDIILLTGDVTWAIEVKSLAGKQSPEQKAFEDKWVSDHRKYAVVRSIGDVIKLGL